MVLELVTTLNYEFSVHMNRKFDLFVLFPFNSSEIRAKQVREAIYSSVVSAWYPVLTQHFQHALERARAYAPLLTVLGYDAANYTAATDLHPSPDVQYAAIDENYEVCKLF